MNVPMISTHFKIFQSITTALTIGLCTQFIWAAPTKNTSSTLLPPLEQTSKGVSQQFILSSKYTPHHYLINLYIPNTPAPKTGYPVIYMLDGNAVFDSARNVAQAIDTGSGKMGLDPVVVVAIGYAGDSLFNAQQRALDYTPTAPTEKDKANPNYQYGGAEQFLKFIQTELKPQIFNRTRINIEQQTIFGHSFGGLFVLHTLFKQPNSFQRYVAASPSLWFDHNLLSREQQDWRKQSSTIKSPTYLLTTVGTAEGRDSPRSPNTASGRDFFAGFSRVNTNKLHSWHFYHPAEQHITNLYASIPKAMLLASCNSLANCQKLLDE